MQETGPTAAVGQASQATAEGRIMRYVVYKVVHGGNYRWYAKQLMKGELAPYPIVFVGRNARERACQKAWELNERALPLTLAA